MHHYLFLSSSDSLLPGNTTNDFTVSVPKTYTLKRDWECALLELWIHLPDCRRMNICCDFIEDSCPVLRSIVENNAGSTHFRFELPYFFPVREKDLGRVRIFIRGSDLQAISPREGSVECVLLLRRKKWGPQRFTRKHRRNGCHTCRILKNGNNISYTSQKVVSAPITRGATSLIVDRKPYILLTNSK